MTKFRTGTHDAPEPRRKPAVIPGKIPDAKLGVYDAKGNLRGLVGRLATAATASRFTHHGMKLAKKGGRDAWVYDGKGTL